MGGMPYHLEKGPLCANFEALYNDPVRLPGFLTKLWRGGPDVLGKLGAGGMIEGSTYNDPNGLSSNATGQKRLDSMLGHWFGEQNGQPQKAFSTTSGDVNLTTGYWLHYHGNVREIVYQTLVRAAEVALGVDHQAPAPTAPAPSPSRSWPVEFFWKCGQARFEGW